MTTSELASWAVLTALTLTLITIACASCYALGLHRGRTTRRHRKDTANARAALAALREEQGA